MGVGTRSGLLWEVERILGELTERPQVLLMENVPEVISKGSVDYFVKWCDRLQEFGYSNYFSILNAKDYGIPQNRRRVFMVSLLGNYAYDFPLKHKLKYRLKDFLEKQVDEKYYLSEKMIDYITATGTQNFSVNNSMVNCTISRPSTTEQNKRAGTTNYIADELPEDTDLREVKRGLMIKENNSKGYKIAHNGDGVNLANRMKHQRGNVQNGLAQTLKTQMEVGVVVSGNKKI